MHVGSERPVGGAKHSSVVPEPGEHAVHPAHRRRDGEPGGKRLGAFFEPLDAQQFIAQWSLGRW